MLFPTCRAQPRHQDRWAQLAPVRVKWTKVLKEGRQAWGRELRAWGEVGATGAGVLVRYLALLRGLQPGQIALRGTCSGLGVLLLCKSWHVKLRAIPKGRAWYPEQVKVICFESYSSFWKCSVQICACQESSARVLRGPRLAPLPVAKQTVTLILGLSSEAMEKAGLFFVLTRCGTACPLGDFSPGNFPFPGFQQL